MPSVRRAASLALLIAVFFSLLARCGGADLERYERVQAALRPPGAVQRHPCGKFSTGITCSYTAPGSLYDLRERTLSTLSELGFSGWGGSIVDEPVEAWTMDGKTKLVYTAVESGPPAPRAGDPPLPYSDEWAEVTIHIQADDYHRCFIDCVGRE